MVQDTLAKAREKLRCSQKWFKESSAPWDDITSRAYYAAFHAAQAMLLSEGLEPKTHHGVLTLFHLHFIKSKKIAPYFGRYLRNLKDDREEGDYEIYSSLDEKMTAEALHEASEFLAEAERYLKPCLSDKS